MKLCHSNCAIQAITGIGAEVQALVEHALSGRPGDWRVWIVGSRENDGWEMKILGPNGFERSYTLEGSAGEHQPLVIANVVQRLLPARVAPGGGRKAAEYTLLLSHICLTSARDTRIHQSLTGARLLLFD